MDQQSLLIWGLALGSAATVIYLLLLDRSDHVAERLMQLGDQSALAPGAFEAARLTNQRIGTSQIVQELDQKDSRERLRERVVQAGLYKPQAIALFTTLRMALCVVPVIIGLAMSTLGLITQTNGLLFGLIAGLLGTITPSLWLDRLKRTRQSKIRRSLPDALDVIVVCLEAGLSISSALSRVARELASAHKLLALELRIVEREVQLGATTGSAMRQFAQRFDLEELRSLAAVITQADQFGTSVVKAFRVYADSMRIHRQQRAQELAQKATIKILFPTLLCIFPGIFVVLLGPAAIRIYQALIMGFKGGNL